MSAWCFGATVVHPRWLAAQPLPSGCDAKLLLARADVRQGLATMYAMSRVDGWEHVMLVYPDSVDIHPNAIVAPLYIRFGVPPETIAIVPTHPPGTTEYPSPHDVEAFKRLQLDRPGVCSYVAGSGPNGERPIYQIRTDGTTVLTEFY